MRRDFDEHDDQGDMIPAAVRCCCGTVLATPAGPGPEMILDRACDACAYLERRWLDSQHRERIAPHGPPDDEGQPPW